MKSTYVIGETSTYVIGKACAIIMMRIYGGTRPWVTVDTFRILVTVEGIVVEVPVMLAQEKLDAEELDRVLMQRYILPQCFPNGL